MTRSLGCRRGWQGERGSVNRVIEYDALPHRVLAALIFTAAATNFVAFFALRTYPFHNEDGDKLLFYFFVSGPRLEAILFTLGGIGTGTSMVMLFVTVIRWLRPGWVRKLGGTALGIVLAAAGLVWLLFLLIVGFGSTLNDYLPVTASDGDRVIVDQDPFDGDVVSVWTPYWGPFYEPTVVTELSGSHAVRKGDCSLDSPGAQLLLTCGDTHVILERAGRNPGKVKPITAAR